MARAFQVPGECLVLVKGNVASSIPTLSELGLSEGPIQVVPRYVHSPIVLDAHGHVPVENQMMLCDAAISMALINYDNAVLQACLQEAAAGVAAGTQPRAGTLMGGGVARFAVGNHYIGLNLTSPVMNFPYRFLYAMIMGSPRFPMGTEKSVVQINFQAVAYMVDPWNGGLGASGSVVWDNTLDT